MYFFSAGNLLEIPDPLFYIDLSGIYSESYYSPNVTEDITQPIVLIEPTLQSSSARYITPVYESNKNLLQQPTKITNACSSKKKVPDKNLEIIGQIHQSNLDNLPLKLQDDKKKKKATKGRSKPKGGQSLLKRSNTEKLKHKPEISNKSRGKKILNTIAVNISQDIKERVYKDNTEEHVQVGKRNRNNIENRKRIPKKRKCKQNMPYSNNLKCGTEILQNSPSTLNSFSTVVDEKLDTVPYQDQQLLEVQTEGMVSESLNIEFRQSSDIRSDINYVKRDVGLSKFDTKIININPQLEKNYNILTEAQDKKKETSINTHKLIDSTKEYKTRAIVADLESEKNKEDCEFTNFDNDIIDELIKLDTEFERRQEKETKVQNNYKNNFEENINIEDLYGFSQEGLLDIRHLDDYVNWSSGELQSKNFFNDLLLDDNESNVPLSAEGLGKGELPTTGDDI